MMNIINNELKSKQAKEVYANSNYLNFIKKNHQLIKQQINMNTLSRDANPQKSYPLNGYITNKREENRPQLEFYSKLNHQNRKVIHDSLSKFDNKDHPEQNMSMFNHNQSKLSMKNKQDQKYNNILNKNDEIVQKLITKNMKSKEQQQIAKQLLFHLNKNKSPNCKKVLTRISLDRYQTLQQPQIQLNLKFPIIEKKSHATIQSVKNNKEKPKLIHQLRQKVKEFNFKQKSKDLQFIFGQKAPVKKYQQIDTIQEMYKLFPSFKSHLGSRLQSQKKKEVFFNNGTKHSSLTGEEQINKFLQDNMIMKGILMAKREIKHKDIFNKEILDKSDLQILKEEFKVLQVAPRQCFSQVKSTVQLPDSKQIRSQVRHKFKKEPLELKYDDSQLSIYDIKMRQYRQFLFMINLCHRIYDPIVLKDNSAFKPQNRYKYHLGKGNNYLLVKSLLKRRYWWSVQEDPKKVNFLWTQLKVNYFYQIQKKCQVIHRYHKVNDPIDEKDKIHKKKKKIKLQNENKTSKGGYKAPLPENDRKIFTEYDKKNYDQFLIKAHNPENLLKYSNRLKYFQDNFFKQRHEDLSEQKVHNHLQFNYFIGNKKALFYNLKQYYELLNKNVFDYIPLTFHIKQGAKDPSYQLFIAEFKKFQRQKKNKKTKNIWIVKPGQLSNRGQGITVIDQVFQLNTILKKKLKHSNGIQKTFIVQKYLQNPLLYKSRKFDIRHYMMISRLHGVMRAYWFGQGYIRTSSSEFNLSEVGDPMIHLTNDAIQKYSAGYGKYEQGNKISYGQFQRYMDGLVGQGKFSFSEMIYPKMKSIALDAIKSTYLMLDSNNTQHNFEVFGLDFMIDSNYNVWLIEVNTNPCLELSSKLLARIIPTMIEQTLKLTLDVIFPPPAHYPNSQKYLAPDNPLERSQFELIFDQDRDGKQIKQLYQNANKIDMGAVDEEDETYQNDGKEIQLDNQIQ